MRAETKTKSKRRRYTAEFKAGAVRLVLEEGKSMAEVSDSLGINPSLISTWVRQAKIDAGKGPPGALTTSENGAESAGASPRSGRAAERMQAPAHSEAQPNEDGTRGFAALRRRERGGGGRLD